MFRNFFPLKVRFAGNVIITKLRVYKEISNYEKGLIDHQPGLAWRGVCTVYIDFLSFGGKVT